MSGVEVTFLDAMFRADDPETETKFDSCLHVYMGLQWLVLSIECRKRQSAYLLCSGARFGALILLLNTFLYWLESIA